MLAQKVRVFNAVATHLSFSRAALELSISQPGVTFHIKALEREYGADLFERVGKRLYLTDAGRALAGYVQRMALMEEEARLTLDELKGLSSGTLVVGASATIGIYVLPEVVGEFRKRHPGIKVSLRVGNKRHTIERLLKNEVDFGLVAGPIANSALSAEPYLDDELVIIVSPSHRFAHEPLIYPGELRRETFLVREPGSGTQELMEERLAHLGIAPADTMQLGSTEAIKQAVAADLGISIASRYSVEAELDNGRLRTANVPSLVMKRRFLLLHHKDKRLSRTAIAFRLVLHEMGVRQQERAGLREIPGAKLTHASPPQ
ncbi:MAG: LysR substrate-binding domain-containing protein [Chloroflexota bacterium]|nr:MAG: LysR family transcriptional regulator [Chloroflexota bacterium]